MFYLIKNDKKTWIFESDTHPTVDTHPQIKGYNSLSAGHETMEDLILKHKLSKTPCKHCNQIFATSYHPPYDTVLMETSTCFSCHLWLERAEQFKVDTRIMIVDWEWHTVSDENSNIGHFRGHGGRKFKFKIIADGVNMLDNLLGVVKRVDKIVVSTNVWYGGKIPEHLRHLFYNNAIIIHEQYDLTNV